MELTDATIQTLRAQEGALRERIAELEEAMLASSTSGIREFRRTRLLQLEGSRIELSDRLDRIGTASEPTVEAHQIGTALRDVASSTQGTFGC